MSTSNYAVTGMTCNHCVQAVTTEIESVAGVQTVQVDLETGKVSVEGEGFTDEQVAAAVDEAGYELAQTPAPS